MLAALLLAMLPGEAAAAGGRTIPAGLAVPLVTQAPLSSRTAAKGDQVDLLVAEDVLRDGVLLIAKGTRGVGELIRAEPKAAFGVAGKLEARLLYLWVDDTPVRIEGALASQGKSATGGAVASGVAIGTLSFVVTGRSAAIPAGTRVAARVVRTVTIGSR